MLNVLLRNEMQRRGLSSHSAAELIGVSHTTVLRTLRGENIDVDTLAKFADFLGMRPADLLNSINPSDLATQVAVLFAHSPELEAQFEEAVQAIKDGRMDVSTLRDVLSYAIFKFQQAGAQDVRDRGSQSPGAGQPKERGRRRTRSR